MRRRLVIAGLVAAALVLAAIGVVLELGRAVEARRRALPSRRDRALRV